MGFVYNFLERARKLFDNTLDTYGFNATNTPKDDPAGKLSIYPAWFFSAKLGQPRNINTLELRDFAKSPWIQMVLNTIKKEILTIDWDVLKKDVKDDVDVSGYIKELKSFFEDINSEHETISDISSQAITDVGEIDSGVWQKVFTKDSYEEKDVTLTDNIGNEVGTNRMMMLKDFGKRDMIEIRPADSSTFLIDVDRFRRLRWYWQYSFKNPMQNPIAFEPDEIVWLMMNQKTYSVYGFSPVQAIQQVLEVLIQSTRWNKDFFKNNAIPDGIVGLENANPDSMKRFKTMWNQEAKGRPHKLLFHNTKVNFSSFNPTSKDMEWLQGQKWYFHLVFAVFGVSPAEAGFYEDVNRSAQEGQERVTVKNAIKPYLKMLENAINKSIIPEFFQEDDPPVKFEFKPVDHTEEQIEHTQAMDQLDRDVITINEIRQKKGMEPVEWGDVPLSSRNQVENVDINSDNDSAEMNNEETKYLPYTKAFEGFMNGRNTDSRST